MNGITKDQHYIPQMYLKRFAGPDGLLYAFDLPSAKGMKNKPRAFAHRKFFYDLEPTRLRELLGKHLPFLSNEKLDSLSQEQLIERMLGRIERGADEMINGIESGEYTVLDEQVQAAVIVFIYALSVRTLSQRSTMERIYTQLKPIVEQFHPTAGEFAHLCDSTSENYAKETQISELISLRSVQEFALMILSVYNWHLADTSGSLKLIISDNPAQMIALGFNDICFPISHNKAIVLRPKEQLAPLISEDMPVGNHIALSDKSVLSYNMLQLHQANRFLFGDADSIMATIMANNPSSNSTV